VPGRRDLVLSPTVTARFPTLALLAALPFVFGCTPQGDPGIGPEGFIDDFDRAELGDDWNNTGASWRIEEGELRIEGAHNRPLWLRRSLPRDVRIEVDVQSDSAAGDIKLEIFGDGTSRATSASYTATSYVVIFGGWNNSMNVLARMNEHGDDRVVGPALRVEPGRRYHFKIERRGSMLVVWVDGRELLRMDDPHPLYGRGHDHFAFNDWEASLHFDNLRITPL
jgi:hypothetical protein